MPGIFKIMRFKSLQNNRIVRYLSYALGEIILIVLGILIALQINNKNEAKKIEEKRQIYYQQLITNLNIDKSVNKKRMARFNEERSAFTTYKEGFKIQNLNPQGVLKDLKTLSIFHYDISFISYASIESLVSSGDLSIMPPILRNEIIALKRRQQQLISTSKQHHESKNKVLNETLLLVGSFEFQDRIKDNPKLKSLFNNSEKLEETILALEAIQIWKDVIQNYLIKELTKLEKQMDNILTLINKELTNKLAPQSPLIQNP